MQSLRYDIFNVGKIELELVYYEADIYFFGFESLTGAILSTIVSAFCTSSLRSLRNRGEKR